MHIIIPMSGVGQRFIDAGFETPKPLIEIDGKPIIEHVCNLFPTAEKFTFICNSRHLAETNMRKILKGIQPNSKVVEIPNHKKGPVYAVSLISNLIEDDEEVIVNYCDFGTYWDFEDFLKHTRDREADGAVVAYKGFHPHMLGSTNYAFMRDKNQWMLEIKEKEPFTDNRMNEYASNGTYYFRRGDFVKKYFEMLMTSGLDLKGEYYVSLVYNFLVNDGLRVSIYEIQHMLQWGTPEDVQEYQSWSSYFRDIVNDEDTYSDQQNSITLIPLAGRGSRFKEAGYEEPKPLIEVSGKPMIIQASRALPKTAKHIFVTLQEHLDRYLLASELKKEFKECDIVPIKEVTEGQAVTCSLGLKNADEDNALLISATDNSILFDREKYQRMIQDEAVDAIIFTFRHHVSSKNNPHMYGWVQTDKDVATGVSVKVPISKNPYNDHAIVGTFYFKKVRYYKEALDKLLKENIRVNGEFYVDSLIEELIKAGLQVKVLEVDHYIGWGTPDDYESFVYWQSYFQKDENHPYSLNQDKTVNKDKISELKNTYRSFEQEYR